MKKLLFTLMAIVAAISFSACSKDDGETWTDDSPIIEFKDSYFLEALVKSTDNDDGSKIDKNGDGRISEKEASVVKSLDVGGSGIRGIDGISYFTALTTLDCGYNQLTSLDVSKNTALTGLRCRSNQLTSLDVSKNTALTWLDCGSNQITSLGVSKNTALETLDCYGNKLTSLDVSKNTALTGLDCGGNKLTSLDVSKNIALTGLDCGGNKLTSLDVSKNTALTWLRCDSNQITSLDVSKCKKLTQLYCSNNPSLKSIVIYKYYDSRLEYDLNTIIKKYGNIITYKE